jgi:hypothetical protein
MVTTQFDEMTRVLNADAAFMRRTRRIVRRAKLQRAVDRTLESLATLAVVWM